jgi:hypothetical protein
MMIATKMNAAINERARSDDFDRGFVASSGGIRLTQTQKCRAQNGAGLLCRVSFGAMPMVHACNPAKWRRAVWSKQLISGVTVNHTRAALLAARAGGDWHAATVIRVQKRLGLSS